MTTKIILASILFGCGLCVAIYGIRLFLAYFCGKRRHPLRFSFDRYPAAVDLGYRNLTLGLIRFSHMEIVQGHIYACADAAQTLGISREEFQEITDYAYVRANRTKKPKPRNIHVH